MKTRNKVLLTLACALLLVVGSVAGTLAWLTSTSTVTNTFTVGQVKITLDEARVNSDGTTVENADRVSGLNAYHLLPGHTYTKDPTIHVQANSEDCYLFVVLENGFTSVIDGVNTAVKTIEEQMTANGWKQLAGKTNVWYYAKGNDLKTVEKKSSVQNIKLFESFKIKDEATNGNLDAVRDAKINVTAYAIQKDGMSGESVEQIWDILAPAST